VNIISDAAPVSCKNVIFLITDISRNILDYSLSVETILGLSRYRKQQYEEILGRSIRLEDLVKDIDLKLDLSHHSKMQGMPVQCFIFGENST